MYDNSGGEMFALIFVVAIFGLFTLLMWAITSAGDAIKEKERTAIYQKGNIVYSQLDDRKGQVLNVRCHYDPCSFLVRFEGIGDATWMAQFEIKGDTDGH